MRHKFLEWITKSKRATFDSTLRPFQSVELSLHRMLPSRADVRFIQHNKVNQLTQFIEQTPKRLKNENFAVSGFLKAVQTINRAEREPS